MNIKRKISNNFFNKKVKLYFLESNITTILFIFFLILLFFLTFVLSNVYIGLLGLIYLIFSSFTYGLFIGFWFF